MGINDTARASIDSTRRKVETFLSSDTPKVVVGLLLIVLTVISLLAFISFFSTGGADQSMVENLDTDVSEEIKNSIQNWGGYLSACFAYVMMMEGFGVGVFSMVYFIFRLGLHLLGILRVGVLRCLCRCVFFMLWISLLMSFLGIENSFFNFGGYCGVMENNFFCAYVGKAGLFLLLAISMVFFSMLTFGLTLDDMKAFCRNVWNKDYKAVFNDLMGIGQHRSGAGEDAGDDEEEEDEGKDKDSADDGASDSAGADATAGISEASRQQPPLASAQTQEPAGRKPGREAEFVINVPNAEGDAAPEPVTAPEAEADGGADADVAGPDAGNAGDGAAAGQAQEEGLPDDQAEDLLSKLGPYDPTADLSTYSMPDVSLMPEDKQTGPSLDEEEQIANKDRIISSLGNFGIEIVRISATVGPTITLYEIVPAAGVRVSKIQSLEKDLALCLAAEGVRIIAPIPGRGTIGIEVPNKKRQMVSIRSVLASKAFQETKAELPMALGKTISNEVFIADLAKLPHLLVAGATGQGKSVGLNAILVSLLYKKHPATLKFVLVDPKQVEFGLYERICKHYLAKLPGEEKAVISDNTKVQQTITSLTIEMDNRYTLLADQNLRTIKEYNAKFVARRLNPAKEVAPGLYHHFLPYIVVVIDEYGDLIMTAGKEIELPICRIAQKARAVGIHMIIATQRPSVKIVTGTIKANFPARMAFRVSSMIDSKTILDSSGANNLIGKGDMLFYTGGTTMERLQCAYADTPEVDDLTNYISTQRGYDDAYMLPEPETAETATLNPEERRALDPMIRQAAELVVQAQNGSTSNLQRSLSIGFNRAGRLMDDLYSVGVVGPVDGSKPRSVLLKDLIEVDDLFRSLGIK